MTSDFDAAKLATAYRRLVLWFGAQLVLSVLLLVLASLPGGGPVAGLIGVLAYLANLAIIAGLVYYAYRTALALGSSVGWVWGVAMLVPLLNVVTLLILSAKATRACRAHGVPVGFLGPKIAADATRGEHG